MIQTAIPYTGDAATLPLHLIDTAPQIRMRNGFDEDGLRELASTITQHGLLQPLVVRRLETDRYELISGERRLLACTMAGLAEVPVLVRVANDDEVPAIQAVENLQRVDLTLLDRAAGIAAMVGAVGAKRTASMLGKSPAYVSKHLAVAKMPDEVRAIAAAGLCEDIEVLGALKQIRSRSRDAFDRACVAIEAGTASRDSIRATLETLRKPSPVQPPLAGTDPDEAADDDEGSADPSGTVTLRLSSDDQSLLLAALAVYEASGLTSEGRRLTVLLAKRVARHA